MTMFSKISAIIFAICGVWLLGLGLFVLIRKIVLKIKKHKRKNKEKVINIKDLK